MANLIEIKNITVKKEDHAIISDFSLSLLDKGIVCVFGPSGCGKTTFLKALAGLVPLSGGCITGLEHKKTAFLFQEDRLLPWLSALANTELVLNKEDKAVLKAAAIQWLERFGLSDSFSKYPNELSGGMQRRVSLAAMFAYGGDVFLMDEPTRGLDAALSQTVMDEIIKLGKEKTVVVVTHSVRETVLLADKAYIVSGTPLKTVDQIDFKEEQEQRKENVVLTERYIGLLSGYTAPVHRD